MRLLGACVVGVGLSSLFSTACSDKARLPTATENDRVYTCDDVTPEPARTGGDTFAELYRDIFSTTGVAKCQTSTCHGNAEGPGGNGMAMYPSLVKAPEPGKEPLTKGILGKHDDRALYCGLTSHRYQRSTHLDPCPDPTGVKCDCKKGDDCKCVSGPNAATSCCAPDPEDPKDTHCDADPATACWGKCGRLVVGAHADGTDSTPDSALLELLSPKDGAPAYMPNPLTCNGNRHLLPEELARIQSWLKRGAPYDGATIQPAYDCPLPVKPQ